MVLQKKDKVQSYLTDYSACLSIIGMFSIAEGMVSDLTGELKIDGITVKAEYNALMLLVQSKLRILKDIPWNDVYIATCYICKVTPFSLDVCVEIRNESEEICSLFITQVCALDLKTKKIRKLSTIGVDKGFLHGPAPLNVCFSRFGEEELLPVSEVEIRSTNIDYVGHTNNKEYIRFILDTYDFEDLKENPIKDFEITFINQSFEHDRLAISKKTDIEKDEIAIQKDGENIIKAHVIRESTMLKKSIDD